MSQNNKAVAIWFTGLSASGKSTLSEALYNKLKEKNVNNLILLDGEFVRDKLKYYGYETTNRNEIGIQKSKLALKYINKGNHTIITGIAHHKETRKIIRNMFPYFYEIYLKCDVEVCANRDFKGNYKKAFDGEYDNFIGYVVIIYNHYSNGSSEKNILKQVRTLATKITVDEKAT